MSSAVSSCPLNLPLVAEAKDMPLRFSVVERLQDKPQLNVMDGELPELLGVIMYEGEPLPEALLQLQSSSDDSVARILQAHRFTGRLGETLLIDLRMLGHSSEPRYVQIVGAGAVRSTRTRCEAAEAQFDRMAFCAVFGTFLESAASLWVSRMTIALDNVAEMNVDITGLVALLRCRTLAAIGSRDSALVEVRVLVQPEQFAQAEWGLNTPSQLCVLCREPRLSD